MSQLEIFLHTLWNNPIGLYAIFLGTIFLAFVFFTSVSGYFGWEKKIKPSINKARKKKHNWKKFVWVFFAFLLVITFFIPHKKIFYFLFIFSLGVVFFLWQQQKKEHRKKKIIAQIPLFLQALSNTLQAGQSLPQAFTFVESDLETPLKEEIIRINQQVAQNISLKEALQNFSDTINHPDVQFFVDSIVLQIDVGGNLVQVFEKIRHALEERFKLQRDIKSFTAQGKMSGLFMACLWPISLFVFWKLSPEHINVLFETKNGNLLLGLSALLEIFGFIAIWKIVRIKI